MSSLWICTRLSTSRKVALIERSGRKRTTESEKETIRTTSSFDAMSFSQSLGVALSAKRSTTFLMSDAGCISTFFRNPSRSLNVTTPTS